MAEDITSEKEKEEEKIDVGKIAEGEDEEVAAAKPAKGRLAGAFQKLRGQFARVLGYSIGAILIILIAVGISYVVSSNVFKKPIFQREGKLYFPPPPPPAYFDIGEFKMSTADKDETHFLRIKITLGYKNGDLKLAAELGERRVQILDIVNSILRGKVKTDFESQSGTENLKIEIQNTINRILQSGRVEKVFFTEVAVM